MPVLLPIILLPLLAGGLPAWPYVSGRGYDPGGGMGLPPIVFIVPMLTGRI
jgi:hypothetical protein